MDKQLELLNQLEVVEFSTSGTELEYVLVENTESNRLLLESIGMRNDDYETMIGGEEENPHLEISYFAWSTFDADWWDADKGFTKTKKGEV